MTPQSLVAIEYIHILNTAIHTPECTRDTMVPTHPPPTKKPVDNFWWIALIVCLSILLISIILIGVYCIVKSFKNQRGHECAAK